MNDELNRADDDSQTGFVIRSLHPEFEERLRAAVERALPTAGPDFGQSVQELQRAVERGRADQLLGIMTMYGTATKVGTNPEFDRPLGLHQFHMELVQAFALKSRRTTIEPTYPVFVVLENVAKAVQRFADAWTLLEVRKVQRSSTDHERDLAHVLFTLRNNAAVVRGWGYPSPMLRMLEAMFAPLDEVVEDALGWRPSALPRWWAAMMEVVNKRLQRHREAVREARSWPADGAWLSRVRERFGMLPVDDDDSLIEMVRTSEDTRWGFVLHSSDLRAHEIFRFDLAELVRLMPESVEPTVVRSILDSWTVAPGGYDDVAPNVLPVENPACERPFVGAGPDAWHLFCAWVLLHNPFELIERLLIGREDLFEMYLRQRAEFLEGSVAGLLSLVLPGARVEHDVLYSDPADGREYESDVLALIDSYAVVAEAKSGRLGPEMRRGKGRQLRDRVAELLVAPSEQANRLAHLLANSSGPMSLRRKADGSVITIDADEIHRALTLGATLEPLAGVLPRLREVAESGLSEQTADALAYSISLPDLVLLGRLLAHPSEILHYLSRRADIERSSFLRGDEGDLLGLYLETGFNLGQQEFEDGYRIDITGMSDPIDTWHYAEDAGVEATRPTTRRTEWWERLLNQVESSRPKRWVEVGVSMCNVAFEDQVKFRDAMKRLDREIADGQRPTTDMVVFQNGPPQRRDVFVGLIAKSTDPGERREQYAAAGRVAARECQASRVTVLAWKAGTVEGPYLALGVGQVREHGK